MGGCAMTGVGPGFILTVVFVILKLTAVIGWSWWLVFLPLLITSGVGIVALIIFIGIALVTHKQLR